MKVEQLVVFAIIMENGRGIVGKSPDYIFEKWRFINSTTEEEFLTGKLNMANHAKYKAWKGTWRRETDAGRY